MSCFAKYFNGSSTEKYKKVDAFQTVVTETQTSDFEMVHYPQTTVVIVDCGSSKLKAGFAGDETPLVAIPTVVGKSVSGDATKKVFGSKALASSSDYKISYPVERGFIKDFHSAEDLLEYVFDNQLHMQPKMHQLLLTEALNNPPANREKTAEMIFEKFEFNSFILLPSTLMAMYGYGSITGVMVESGAGQTHIVAIKNGDYIRDSYRNIPLGGDDLSKYMGEMLSRRGKTVYFRGKQNEREILDHFKHIGCHVALNYDKEIYKLQTNPSYLESYVELRDGDMFSMDLEAFQVPELLFKPDMIAIQTGGLPENIYDCIESCDPALKAQLYGNICLCGGNTMFKGIEDRLLWEVKTYAGPKVTVKINAPPIRENLAFLGASLVGVCSKLKDNLISYQEYREVGPQIVDWKLF